ncbi:MAG: protoheme IX farnesyltransferase [Geminicoccaceae bacterium]|jgi:protoheme IX farnesyltransferase|nr:heme o synthase [Geminicoccaceae bacterium]MCB9966179.1 protoheme IX farnesyltransferase [Geminicoccaceae bacterium]HRY26125.1 heme o synthase [Geminicoccaceae bacterium]
MRPTQPLVQHIVSVFKLRIAVVIALSALAGVAVAPGAPLSPAQILVLTVAVLLSSGAAGAFNQLFERDLDALMVRTRRRPFASGEWRGGPLWWALILAILALGVGMAGLVLNAATALYLFLGAFTYGVVYTVWLKRRTVWNIVIGGLAGSFAVLAGAAAVDPSPSAAPLVLAVVLFLWTPPHFWSLALMAKDDYAANGVPMLPAVKGDAFTAWAILVHAIALAVLAVVPFFLGMGWIYLAAAVVGGAGFVRTSLALVRRPSRATAFANFKSSLLQLSLLLVGAMGDAALLG